MAPSAVTFSASESSGLILFSCKGGKQCGRETTDPVKHRSTDHTGRRFAAISTNGFLRPTTLQSSHTPSLGSPHGRRSRPPNYGNKNVEKSIHRFSTFGH